MTIPASAGEGPAPRIVSSASLEGLHDQLTNRVLPTPEDENARAGLRSRIADALVALKAHEVRSAVMSAPQDKIACVVQSAIAEHARDHHVEHVGLFHHVRFARDVSHFDAGYYHVVLGAIEQRLSADKRVFDRPASELEPLDERVRMTLIGDFGTGLYGASHIKDAVEKASADGDAQDVLVHLGDVYYTGTEKEVEERFLPFFPSVAGAVRRACNGNHDMYGGGDGYARILREFGQRSNCFGFRNADWMLLGLDTAYAEGNEGDISAEQVAWLESRIAEREGRRVVVVAHHPVFTQAKPPSAELLGKLRPLLEAKCISAWYAGHEHLCAVYDYHEPWGLHARCLGHGALPDAHPNHAPDALPSDAHEGTWTNVPRADGHYDSAWYRALPNVDLARGGFASPPAAILDGGNPYVTGMEQQFSPNGYGVLNFEGMKLTEAIYSADGQRLYERTLYSEPT